VNAQRWEEIQVSFDELVELNASQRVAHLATLAKADPELHRALESLLMADDTATARLEAIDIAFLPGPDRASDPLGLAGRTISHFVVGEALGAGGMGVVYRADDTRLGRAVALKFLLPPYNLDAAAKTRFLREAKAVAALDNPNLCALYEVGTSDDGWLFLAMALYEGETLRARLTREGLIPLRDAIDMSRQIAQGLHAAHSAGIVHRDLKPGNVMLLPDGTVRILDFGLAKVRDQSVTETGGAFGTVSFMSPEQILAGKVDGRADLWALGVVLYEMLTGRKPFGGEEEVAIAHAIIHDEPQLPSTHRRGLPAALESLVLRLLRKDPAKRPADAAELLGELARIRTFGDGPIDVMRTRWRRSSRRIADMIRPVSGGLLLTISAVAVITAVYLVSKAALPANRGVAAAAEVQRSIAVLPFKNVGGDPSNAPFSDGIADELTTTLGKIDQLNVMARASAFSLTRKGLEAREIGRQLNVQYVLAGSVESEANRRMVKANLIDVANGMEIWSQNFENDALNRDVFAVEDSITRSIVRQIVPRISPLTFASVVRRQTENPAAHDLYFQGRFFFEKRDSASFTKAQEYFRRAILIDSSYALAYAGLADAYSQQATFGFASAAINYLRAKDYASRALAHDSTLEEVHTSLGFIALFYEWDWPTAGREFQTALRLNGRYAPAHLFRAWYFLATDSVDAAINEGRRAVDLDPFSSLNNTRLVGFLFFGRRYSEALDQGRKTFERDSSFVALRQELARVYVQMGRCPQALAVIEHSVDQPVAGLRGVRGYTYAKCGRRAEALAELNRLRGEAKAGRAVSHYPLAVIEAGLGDKEQAITELQRAYTEHVWPMYLIKVDPAFADIRTDPRFIALVHKIGLTP
jgi:serine/threonine protein kinase/tetratricopeptide (TPR) repeat protein